MHCTSKQFLPRTTFSLNYDGNVAFRCKADSIQDTVKRRVCTGHPLEIGLSCENSLQFITGTLKMFAGFRVHNCHADPIRELLDQILGLRAENARRMPILKI